MAHRFIHQAYGLFAAVARATPERSMPVQNAPLAPVTTTAPQLSLSRKPPEGAARDRPGFGRQGNQLSRPVEGDDTDSVVAQFGAQSIEFLLELARRHSTGSLTAVTGGVCSG